MRHLIIGLLVATLIPYSAVAPGKNGYLDSTKHNVLASNECFPKGGLGIINTDLYISLKSANNELRFGEKGIWTGFDRRTPQIATFFAGRVFTQEELPDRFDMSQAVVISFERGVVRFFDFSNTSGGFYKRQKAE